MKKMLLIIAILAGTSLIAEGNAEVAKPKQEQQAEPKATESVKPEVKPEAKNEAKPEPRDEALSRDNIITISVIGQGVAPESTISPYQAVALAKKAAIADGYRMLAEKLNGVKVEGYDLVKNMVVQRSQVKTCVSSMIRHANIVETKCAKDFCEVEMELKVVGSKWYSELVSAYK